MEIKLIQTCGACPEQYDAMYNGKIVGYLRLRHGYFQVRYPSASGELIFEANTRGDGIFDSGEREEYLEAAKDAIKKKLVEKLYGR